MGSNNLAARSDGQTVQADDVNQFRNAFIGDQVPRNASGAAEDAQGSLGTSTLQWDNLYLSGSVVIDGNVVDFSRLTTEGHQILSGKVTSTNAPDFLSFTGSTTTGRILGGTTNLRLVINSASVTVSSDIDVTGLTTAPSANNTCLVNDADLAGTASTKYLGEDNSSITIDTIGSEISALDGTVQVFKKGSEYFLAYVDTSDNKLWPFKRGLGASSREALTDNDTITLMQANYIFIDSDATTTYKTTLAPTSEASDPSSPTSNQWYFNTTTKRWKRYSSSWSNMDAHLLGVVICDSSYAVASDPADFDLQWKSDLEGTFRLVDDDTIRVLLKKISVAGRDFYPQGYGQEIKLSVSGDRESGVSEAANTTYYIYCDDNLKFRFSDVAPRLPDHRLGMYHPSKYWRYVGYAINDSSSNLSSVTFNGDQNAFTEEAAVIPGMLGTAAPVYVDATSFSVARIDECDSTGVVHIFKNSSTTVSISGGGINAVAQSSNLTGTISVSSGGNTVTGIGTTFLTDFVVGDVIRTNGGQSRRVTAITNDLSITVDASFTWSSNETGVAYKRGGEASNTWYYLYAVGDGSNAGLLLSTRNVAGGQTLVDLPSGYEYYRQLRYANKNNASGNLLDISVAAGWPERPLILYNTEFPEARTSSTKATEVLDQGTQTSFTSVSCASYIPPISQLGYFYILKTSSGSIGYVRKTGSSLTNGHPMQGYDETNHPIYCSTNSSQSIDYKVSSSAMDIHVAGYVITEVA